MFRRTVALVLLALLLVSSPAYACRNAGCGPTPRIVMNGKELPKSPPLLLINGRILVPARLVGEMLPDGGRVEWDSSTGEVTITEGEAHNPHHMYVKLNPRTESPVVEVGNRYGDSALFELDTHPRIVGDKAYVPARLIPDAFNCFSTWDQTTRTYFIDCSRPANLHEDITRIMEHEQPVLNSDGYFELKPGPYKMYPTTYRALLAKIQMSNNALLAVEQLRDKYIHLRYDKANNRVILLNSIDMETPFGYVYRDYLTMVVDEKMLIRLKYRLTVEGRWEGFLTSAGGALIGIWIPGLQQYVVVKVAATALLGGGATVIRNENEISRLETCMALSDEKLITVGVRWPDGIQCIPAALNGPVYWRDFEMMGVN